MYFVTNDPKNKSLMITISNPKQSSCNKKCVAPKKAIVKKDVKSKVAANKWLDGRLMD